MGVDGKGKLNTQLKIWTGRTCRWTLGVARCADLGWGVYNRNPDGALEIRHEGHKPNGSGLFLNKA